MIQLNNIVADIKDIDPIWTFSHYLGIPREQFNGSTMKIKSIFKPDERTPSFCIYYKNNNVKFNDFATGKKGDHINLVQYKENLNYSQSCFRIMDDYTKWAMGSTTSTSAEIIIQPKYKVTGFIPRSWTVSDKEFFLPFDIGQSRLEWGNVKPLDKYKMSNGTDDIVISGEHMYGYFTKKGELYKIYQPKHVECKFISVKADYDVGSDHREGNKFYGILSSWKDALSFRGLDLKIDLKVPTSENSYFSKGYMKQLKHDYKGGFTLLDNDQAGIKAMKHYQKEYGVDFVYLDLSKDFSDSTRDHGKQKVRSIVVPLIHKSLNK